MKNVKRIYEITAENHFGDIKFEMKTIDELYANTVFEALVQCVDVVSADVVDCCTGEVLKTYNQMYN